MGYLTPTCRTVSKGTEQWLWQVQGLSDTCHTPALTLTIGLYCTAIVASVYSTPCSQRGLALHLPTNPNIQCMVQPPWMHPTQACRWQHLGLGIEHTSKWAKTPRVLISPITRSLKPEGGRFTNVYCIKAVSYHYTYKDSKFQQNLTHIQFWLNDSKLIQWQQ